MIRNTGWSKYSIWEHSAHVSELYKKRCERTSPELTCHIQASELLSPLSTSGDTVLDVGCGTGYFYHSIAARNPGLEYYGIDGNEQFIQVGRGALPKFGLPPARLSHIRIEDSDFEVDHVVCTNVLSNIDNFHRPLERMLIGARKSVIIRESFDRESSFAYVKDQYLDEDVDLKVYVNTYAKAEVEQFLASYGFTAKWVTDRYTDGKPQLVIGYAHHWQFLIAERRKKK